MQTITIDSPLYPQAFRDYRKAPQTFYIDGDASLLTQPTIAIVGTRTPTDRGYSIACSIARYFAERGYVIVSGLAKEIDTAAHTGALSIENGKTIAVMATPLSQIYPPENEDLAKEIVFLGGLLLTEYTTEKYAPYRFVDRDYLQALLSQAVIPVQAGRKSGTMHACQAALDNNIDLFVPVPVARDEREYPEQYGLIRELMEDERVISFRGREEYPKLLELLQS